MARLNKTQVYAVNWLLHSGKSIEEIVHELKIDIKQVKNIVEKNNQINKSGAAIEDKQKPAVNNKGKDLIINTTLGKKTKSVSIMTKEASEYHDFVKDKTKYNNKIQKGIFIPSEKKTK
jgi:hypothetical protein